MMQVLCCCWHMPQVFDFCWHTQGMLTLFGKSSELLQASTASSLSIYMCIAAACYLPRLVCMLLTVVWVDRESWISCAVKQSETECDGVVRTCTTFNHFPFKLGTEPCCNWRREWWEICDLRSTLQLINFSSHWLGRELLIWNLTFGLPACKHRSVHCLLAVLQSLPST